MQISNEGIEKKPGGKSTTSFCSAAITAVVVCYNEASLLPRCLKALQFCDEIIVVDVGSADDSAAIARKYGATVLQHEWVPFGEKVRHFAMGNAKHKWTLFIDPDEVVPPCLASQMRDAIHNNPDAALIRVPWQFYFKGKPLRCCIWGRQNSTKSVLIHRDRVKLSEQVHTFGDTIGLFGKVVIPRQDDNALQHYWMQSYKELFEKHLRYIRYEGERRFTRGDKYSLKAMTAGTFHALKQNLTDYRGMHCGFTGIFLSLFYSWYVFMGWISLRQYERNHKRGE